jgi:hypothetical protein
MPVHGVNSLLTIAEVPDQRMGGTRYPSLKGKRNLPRTYYYQQFLPLVINLKFFLTSKKIVIPHLWHIRLNPGHFK